MKSFFFFFFIILSLFFRSLFLTSLPAGLHWDEQDTAYQAYSLFLTGKDYFGNSLPLFVHSLADYRTPVFIYSAVPFVASLGLSPLSARLPSLVWGTLTTILFYVLLRHLFPRSRIGLLGSVVFTFSPWFWVYNHTSVECNSMLPLLLLGLTGFLKGLRHPTWFFVSALGFGMAIAAYSPAKFFVPIFLLALLLIHFRQVMTISLSRWLLPALLLALITGPILYDGFFGPSSTRFKDVSIFNNPTLAQDVDFDRFRSAAALFPNTVGISPSLVNKISFNKLQRIWWEFSGNYLRTFSPEYLFLRGDTELRHSPGVDIIGQLHLPEVLPLLIGVLALYSGRFGKKTAAILFAWLLIGAIPSALTRGGGPHAARTFLMLPAFLAVIYAGLDRLSHFRPVFLLYGFAYLLSVTFIFNYIFTTYRVESPRPFQWGFDQAISYALSQSDNYAGVIIDTKQDSALMAFLFSTSFDPAEFQSLHPFSPVAITPEVMGHQFGHIYLLTPGIRHWTDIYNRSDFPAHQLIISDATQPLLNTQIKPLHTILYPDSSAAFFAFSN